MKFCNIESFYLRSLKIQNLPVFKACLLFIKDKNMYDSKILWRGQPKQYTEKYWMPVLV